MNRDEITSYEVPEEKSYDISLDIEKQDHKFDHFEVLATMEDENGRLLEDELSEQIITTNERFGFRLLLECITLFLIFGALVSISSVPYLRSKKLAKLDLWKWLLLVSALVSGRLISLCLVRILIFLMERNSLFRKRVLYFVYGLKNAVQYCLWIAFVMIVWHFLFDKDIRKEHDVQVLKIVNKVLMSLLVGAIIWLLKTIMIKVLAFSFHISAFFERIQESLFNNYVIQTLSGPPLTASPSTLASERVILGGKRTGPSYQKERIKVDYLMKLNLTSISTWNMKRLMKIIRNGNESSTKTSAKHNAEDALRKIYLNVASPNSSYIYIEDIKHFMREEDALKTLSFFEGSSQSKRISKCALKNWVVCAFRERRALSLTLNDTKEAVKNLHQLVNIVVGVILVMIWLIIFGFTTTKALLFIASQVAIAAFIFKNTCKTVFEAIIFLFVTHPFDVGDLCKIEGGEMVVDKMNILTTEFSRFDNHEKIIYANSVLATMSIGNYRRTPNMSDSVEFFVSIDTPPEKISQLKERIKSYIEEKHWSPACTVTMKDIIEEKFNMVRMEVWTRRMKHEVVDERITRRSELLAEIIRNITELEIQHHAGSSGVNKK